MKGNFKDGARKGTTNSGVICRARRLSLATCLVAGCFVLVPYLEAAVKRSITDTSNNALSVVVPLGTLTPALSGTPVVSTVKLRLRDNDNQGYRLVVTSATFSATPTQAVAGGTTIGASDIGVGISSVTYGSGVNMPRTDTIATGFNYNPATISAVNGLSPFSGAASGRANVQDMVGNPDMILMSGPRIDNSATMGSTDYIEITLAFAVVPQYFTPATLSLVVNFDIQKDN
jgi:hypothetical protein